MKLNVDRMAVLSGIENEDSSSKLMTETLDQGQTEQLNESVELDRLRQVIREEVQAVISEIRAEKDLKSLNQAMNDKSVGAAMGFAGVGFGQNPQNMKWGGGSTEATAADSGEQRAPVAGMLRRGDGF